MIRWANYHQHCSYCEGIDSPDKIVEFALQKQMQAIGFSSRAPLPFNFPFVLTTETLPLYCQSIETLQKRFRNQIHIYLAIEVDYLPYKLTPSDSQFDNFAYTIGAVHLISPDKDTQLCDASAYFEIDGSFSLFKKGLRELFDNDIQFALETYHKRVREMVTQSPPTILAYLDKYKINNKAKAYFSEDDAWYRNLMLDTIEVISKSNVIIEVNTKWLYKNKSSDTFPSFWVLEHIKELGIPICLGSGAGLARETLALFPQMANLLHKIGFEELWALEKNGWEPHPFSENGIVWH